MTNEQIEKAGEGMKRLIAAKMRTTDHSVFKAYCRGIDDMVRVFKKAMEREKETR